MAKTQRRSTKGRAAPEKTQPKPSTEPWYRRQSWPSLLIGAAAAATAVVALRSGSADAPRPGVAVARPVVGGDLHSLVVDPSDGGTLYIGSHQGVSVSDDGGESWEVVPSLDGADAMGWAFSRGSIFVGGHPGLSVSAASEMDFAQRNDGLPSTDVHALGGGEEVLYAGLAGVGTFASDDGGSTWQARSEQFGGTFMGRILVDPRDDEHLIASDMQHGVVESSDGGRTWDPLGGVEAPMWVTWDPQQPEHLIATSTEGAAESIDGGITWRELNAPAGASIVEMDSERPQRLYGAVLDAPEATVFVSEDGGNSWSRP